MSDISDGEVLYRYANPNVFPEGQTELPLSIFNDVEMSCDWEKLQPAPENSPHVKMEETYWYPLQFAMASGIL